MTRPAVSVLADEVYATLGPALTDSDRHGGWLMLRLVDAIVSPMADIDEVAGDQVDGSPGWGALLDVERCPDWALDWLGQFVGVTIPADAHGETSRRGVVREEGGMRRGTVAAIQAAARRYLHGEQRVVVDERTTSAYRFSVTIYEEDLLAPTYGEMAASYGSYAAGAAAFATYDEVGATPGVVHAAVLAAKPAGLVLEFTAVPVTGSGESHPAFGVGLSKVRGGDLLRFAGS